MARLNKFVAGMLVGAAVGAAAGVLLAPQSGKDTRKVLGERAGRMGKKAGTRLGSLLHKQPGNGVTEAASRSY